jgi:hypothetical protein
MMIFSYWIVYVLIGILWLWRFVKQQPKDFGNNNVIASLFIVCAWPFHIIYDMFKK